MCLAPSTIIAVIALIISTINLWFNFFRPAKIECAFTYLAFEKRQPNVGTRILDQAFLCRFSLKNTGTKSATISGVRFRFLVNQKEIFAHPTKEVSSEYIEVLNSQSELFHSNGCPFGEFILSKEEVWKNNYLFMITPNQIENYFCLGGDGLFEIQIFYKRWCRTKWHSAKKKKYKILNPCVFDNKTVAKFYILS
jgi:hypothetical protein